jgi:hypothetical protein
MVSRRRFQILSLITFDFAGSWEDNWFFKITKTNADSRISMLVPSPTDETFKPLIGDKNIDEINDSDDNDSSSSFSNFEYENNFHAKHDQISTTEVSKNLLIELPIEKTTKRNEIQIDSSTIAAAADKLDKEILKITKSSPAIRASDEALFESTANDIDEHIDKEFEEILMDESYIVPGSIAEREKTKWLHAAPIANNPYTSEALEKRLTKIKLKSSLLDVSSENLSPSEDDGKSEKFQLREDITK